jgi:hypothetical protein
MTLASVRLSSNLVRLNFEFIWTMYGSKKHSLYYFYLFLFRIASIYLIVRKSRRGLYKKQEKSLNQSLIGIYSINWMTTWSSFLVVNVMKLVRNTEAHSGTSGRANSKWFYYNINIITIPKLKLQVRGITSKFAI